MNEDEVVMPDEDEVVEPELVEVPTRLDDWGNPCDWVAVPLADANQWDARLWRAHP